MFDYINTWMGRDSKRNKVLWNSAKVGPIKSDFLRPKNYVKKIVLMMIGLLIALIGLVRKAKKCFGACKSF